MNAASSLEAIHETKHSRLGRNAARLGPKTPGHKAYDMNRLAWPSGRGDEVGILHASIDELWPELLRRGEESQFSDLTALIIREEDASAVMLEGFEAGPVSFAHEPGMPKNVLSIVFDANADFKSVWLRVAPLVKGFTCELAIAEEPT